MSRQVPFYYLIIGQGRLAQHLKHYFALEGLSFLNWHRQQPIENLQTLVEHAEKVLLAVSDDAIEDFILKNNVPKEKAIHFSGSLDTKLAYQLHPLMTFSHELYKHEDYLKIPFITTYDSPSLEELIPELTNPFYQIDREHVEMYHALCVLSGNGTILLWQKVFEDFENKLGVPKKALMPYLQRILTNLLFNPDKALTGPWVRSDEGTIEKNKLALKKDKFLPLYESFHDLYKDRRI